MGTGHAFYEAFRSRATWTANFHTDLYPRIIPQLEDDTVRFDGVAQPGKHVARCWQEFDRALRTADGAGEY